MNASTCSLPVGAADRARHAPFLPLRRVSLRSVGWSVLLGVGVTAPAIMLVALFPLPPSSFERNVAVALAPGLAFLKHVLLGPLLEEVVYRGLFLPIGRRYLPDWLAVTGTSLVFGATHFPLGAGTMAFAFVASLGFSWLAIRSGSLWPGFLTHAVVNATAIFMVSPAFGISEKALAMTYPAQVGDVLTLFPAWWTAVSLALVAAAVIMLTREFSRHPAARIA